ncbi:MAG: gamma carbonic anhydrase family protein [Candidatus Eremiobacteraeota bacterium]|nr:gamma carbonic anhydrase family protein [Candidatus Eremiobacteraeota bacterium]
MFIEYRGKSPRVAVSAFVAPSAILIGDVVVDDDSSIWFGVVLRADDGAIRIGARSSIEDNAVIHATSGKVTTVGTDVTVGHCAVLDDCTVEDGALIGSNAVILGGSTVGASSVIAAGSVGTVDERIPPRIVAAGSPAKVRKMLAGRAAEWIAHSTTESLQQAHAYRRDNIGDPHQHELKTTRRKRSPELLAQT